jgi:predicted dehydrogenase
MSHLNRRQFVGSALAVAGFGAGFAIAGTKSSGKILGANETIRIGVAGLNGRGGSHVGEFSKMDGVDITYLIDPDTRTYTKHLASIKAKKGGTDPKTVQDVRKALEDPNLDAISIATPNHWHALMTIWAVEAGKDVYVEKPCSHNVHEGRVAVEAARKHGRIVQHGTQSRSDAKWAALASAVKSGVYGKLLVSRALCYKPRPSIGVKPIEKPPGEVDFNLWLGPAPEQPFHRNLVHYNWHWFWDFGNGDIGNQGVHQMDIARWLIPGATLPKTVMSLGGRFGYKDQGQTPNTQIAVFDFGGTELIFEVRGLPTEAYHNEKVGNIAEFEDGMVVPTRQGLRIFPRNKPNAEGELLPKPGPDSKRGPGSESGHFANFIAGVRSRSTSDLNADILEGHYSAALCHLANVSYRLGKPVPFDAKTKSFGGDKAVSETFERMTDHLARGNGVALDGLTYNVGRTLTMNPETETFVNDPEADRLLTREYRKGFVVPNNVA